MKQLALYVIIDAVVDVAAAVVAAVVEDNAVIFETDMTQDPNAQYLMNWVDPKIST